MPASGPFLTSSATSDVFISVTPHEFFVRQDNNIILELEINVAQAALGDQVRIPTLDGEEDLVIPAGTQTGEISRLKARGVPYLRRAQEDVRTTPGFEHPRFWAAFQLVGAN